MLKKTLISATTIVVLAGISLFAAEKAKEKKAAEKPGQEITAGEHPQRPGALLDELAAAYKANDREKMGQIIQKMEARREKMRKFAQFNRWHQWAHRREAMRHRGQGMAGPQWGRGCGPAYPGWQQGWGRGSCCPMGFDRQAPCGGPPCQRQFRGGDNWGPGPEMQRQNRGWRDGERNWGPPPGENRPMRGFGHGWGDSEQSFEGPDQMSDTADNSELAWDQETGPQFFGDMAFDDTHVNISPEDQDW